MAVGLRHVQVMGHAAKLQVHVQQQGIACPGAELLGQVAGHQGSAGAALGADHGDQLALVATAQAHIRDQAIQRRHQFGIGNGFGQHVPGAGLHCQAHALLLTQRATHQHRRTFMGRTLQQRRQFFTPQVADA